MKNGNNSSGCFPDDFDGERSALIHRVHGQAARPLPHKELSARIVHEGVSFYFPLGTSLSEKAAVRAQEIRRAIVTDGWRAALRRYPREFTLAVVWAENPMVFTYTTLYTALESSPPASKIRPPPLFPRRSSISVAIVEPEEAVRRALGAWIRDQGRFGWHGLFATGSEALRALFRRSVSLVLFNRHLPDYAAGEFYRAFKLGSAHTPAFPYAIYESSDALFVSQPVVSGGYYFRRRPPDKLLEPIQGLWAGEKLARSESESPAGISAYVQNLFISPPEETGLAPFLTSREREIMACLCQGNPDKEIARALKISMWTVHTHLKKIYGKLGVHSRTEAAVKYLQK